MMMSRTCRCRTAYSMAAAIPVPSRGFSEYGGRKFPLFLKMKRSPGFVWVITVGITRESQQVMNRASGDCPCSASLRKRSWFSLQYCFRNRWTPLISFSMAPPLPGADSRNRGRLGAGGDSSVPAFHGYFIRDSSPLQRDIVRKYLSVLYQCARWTGRLILTPFFTGPFRPGTEEGRKRWAGWKRYAAGSATPTTST